MKLVFGLIFAAVLSAQTETKITPLYWDVTVGPEVNLLAGMSYQPVSAGGFAKLSTSLGGWSMISTGELSRDKKVYENSGMFVGNVTEIGYKLGAVTPEFALYYGRQSNPDYTKAMLSPGMALRWAVGPGIAMYGQYFFPDSGFNHTKRAVFGMDAQLPRRIYVGVICTMVFFDQPKMGGAIAKDVGLEMSARVGYRFGGGEK